MRRVRLRLLACGSCRVPAVMARRDAGLRRVSFPALAGLIEHPTQGIVLFDTGYDPAFLAATARLPERAYRWATPVSLPDGDSAVERLARLGHAPGDVGAVVVSHFHGDHVAGLHRFPRARLFCSAPGLAALRGAGRLGGARRGLIGGLVPPDAERRATFFEDRPVVTLPGALAPFEEAADVLGDGSLLAVPLPGHAPGHWGLVLRHADDRHAFLVADAAYSIGAIEENVPPPALSTALLGETRAARATLRRLHALRGRADLALLPSHCPVAAARFGGEG